MVALDINIFKKDFIYLFDNRERERARVHKQGSSRGRGRIPAEEGARCGM